MLTQLKQSLGHGGIKVNCMPSTCIFNRTGGRISGTISLSSNSDQLVTHVAAQVVEIPSMGRGAEMREGECELGSTIVAVDLPIKAGQSRTVDFQVLYAGGQSLIDQMQAKGVVLDAGGKIGAFADGPRSKYVLRVVAHVKGVALSSKHAVPLMAS